MPTRRFDRSQQYLVPPSLDDWLPQDHPARFVADLVASFDDETRDALGLGEPAAPNEAPRYDPEMLFCVWIYGFMDKRRSSRALERACVTDIAYRWLSGNQHPDHNTLHRFYQAHRAAMRRLFRHTVGIAVTSGMVDWAVVAVDGTKVVANAAPDKARTAKQLETLLRNIDQAIAELEDQQTRDDDDDPPAMPPELVNARQRRERIRAAQAELAKDPSKNAYHPTDGDIRMVKTRRGIQPGYNAQAVVARSNAGTVGTPSGRIILATELTTTVNDQGQLPVMADALVATAGRGAEVLVADKGYHDAASLVACAERGVTIVVPEPQRASPAAKTGRFPQADFSYELDPDTFTCPAGQPLTYRGDTRTRGGGSERRYRAPVAHCRTCSLRAECLGPSEASRLLRVPAGIAEVVRHRQWMATDDARQHSRQRGRLIESVFGTLKEWFGVRRLQRRGLDNGQSEWQLTAAAFNLTTLWRSWRLGQLQL